MEIKVGDEIQVVDEDLKGKVTTIKENEIVFLADDGFEYSYPKSALMFVEKENDVSTRLKELDYQESGSDSTKLSYDSRRDIKFVGKIPVFDLHIETLAPDVLFKTQHEALMYQLEYVKEVIVKAANMRIRRVVFVHGVGKGILRAELRRLLKESYPSIEYFDGSYRKYGVGATEIVIHDFISIE